MLLIAGMRGSGCRERLSAALESVAGVQRVDVNLYRARATVTHDASCKLPELFSATLIAGYSASLPDEPRGDEDARRNTRREVRADAKTPGSIT